MLHQHFTISISSSFPVNNMPLRIPILDKLLPYLLIILFSLCTTSSSTTTTTNDSSAVNSFGVFMVHSPESTVAPKGDEVLFECQLNLVPDKIKWRFRHVNNKWDFNGFNYLDGFNISNEDTTSKLHVYVSPETLGEYQCIAWFGSSAIASIAAQLTLASISLDEQQTKSADQILHWHVSPKNSILIKCGDINSNPTPVWSFYKDGVSIPPQIEQTTVPGALVLNNLTPKDSGTYSCSAMNSITGEEIQLPQRIDLVVEHTQRKAPHFLMQPVNKVSIHPGQTVLLECPGVSNPPPKAVWSSPDVRNNMANNRTTILSYGLQISNVQPQDNGTYTCRLDNGVSPIVHLIRLEVLEKPIILKGPQPTLINESDSLELECIAKGTPTPKIYWMINGIETRKDKEIIHDGGKLSIRNVKKSHAGIVQCFAKNEAGETNENNLLQVNPKQIDGEVGNGPIGYDPTKHNLDHNKTKGRRKHKLANMIPPSRPNITRLSDDSVMLRWYVPKNEGLAIQFFKVQYRMLGDITKKIPRENWQTTNDDIPYGKRDKNSDGIKNFTSSVSGLKPDRFYRFRIIAVYSNNDNKEGNSSGKFLLLRGSALGPTKGHLPAPVLSEVEGISETGIVLHWTLPVNRSNPIDGFYAHYRSASSAGEYTKATIDGMHTRHFKIDNLDPNTAYEFKLQSFTASAASDFSSILTGKTLKPPTPPPAITTTADPESKPSEHNESYYPVIYGAVGGGVLLLIVVITACFCLKRRKNGQQEDEDKPHIDHIQADGHIVSHHKPRLNGVMNITSNPLAHEGDKNRNVMELRFMPTTAATTKTASNTASSNSQGQQQQIEFVGSIKCVDASSTNGSKTPSPIGTTATCIGVKIIGTAAIQEGGELPPKSASTLQPKQTNNTKNTTTTTITTNKLNNHHNNHVSSQNHHVMPSVSPSPPPIPPHLNQKQHQQQQQQQQHQQQQQQQQQQFQQQQHNNYHNHHHQYPSYQNNNHQYLSHHNQQGVIPTLPITNGLPMTPNLEHHRRTLERSNRNNLHHYSPSPPILSRVQRSPMPRVKRNRLGSHNTTDLSSGSLNSIEV